MNHSEAGQLGYQKVRNIFEQQFKERQKIYLEHPNLCITCLNPLPYKKRKYKFCSRSCSASTNNLGKVKNGVPKNKNCLFCGKQLSEKAYKYCGIHCQNSLRWKNKISSIELGHCTNHPTLKKYLIEKRGYRCEICKNTRWMEQEIPLVLDHINGHSEDNIPSNLRLVCGNCDMQLPTYKGRNVGNGRFARSQRYRDGKSY